MNTGYSFRRHDARQASRWPELARFLGSVVGIWAACATGIYLIGPSEPEAGVAAAAAAQSLPPARMAIAAAGYEQ